MELQPVPPDEFSLEGLDSLPSRKRHRQNLQEVLQISNTKPLAAPLRASGRIRIKMSVAAEQKLPEPTTTKVTKVLSNNINIKQRRKPKKLKSDLVSELVIDVKRPSSVLVDTSIRALLTNVAFSQLSPENQKILVESLPLVDRPSASSKEIHTIDLNPSSINNEFFNRACIEWRDRLSNGEFTNEHQTKLRAEHEREKSKIDPWKARNFEGIWGIKSNGHSAVNVGAMMEKSALEMKQRVEQGDFEIPEGFIDDEVWDRKENDSLDDIKMYEEEPSEMMPSPSNFSSHNPVISSSMSETICPMEHEAPDSPDRRNSSNITMTISKVIPDQPVIVAEATSSADDVIIVEKNSPESSPLDDYSPEDDGYGDNLVNHDELPSEGVTTRWYHQHEHDYLKNDIEPESSGMESPDEPFENDIIESSPTGEHSFESNDEAKEPSEEIESPSFERVTKMTSQPIETISEASSYDAELPQEIFQKQEPAVNTFRPSLPSVSTNNFLQQHQESAPLYVRQVINPSTSRFKGTVIIQEERNEPVNYNRNESSFIMDDNEIESVNKYKDEIHMNVAKNVKVLALPPAVKYTNEKFIIEEAPQHIQHQQHIHHQPSNNFRGNGSAVSQPSYFVGGTNFTYISKVGNNIEDAEPSRIVKQETNNNHGQIKQRIIYEIAREPSTHHVAYASQPHQEVFHQMVKHPNGTTTIYETTAPPKKTIIQPRKKTIDPYTVQVMANNNTIILTPIGSTSQQSIPSQPQKSIVHIQRTAPMIQTNVPSVQFLSAPHTFLKKQIIHPHMTTQKHQTNYTTVIRTPAMITPPQQQQQQIQQQQQVITTVSSKIQRPIQKQKVIMSTSSLQQYRSYNQKSPGSHGSRKQLHPQHIIRPSPSPTTAVTNVIHQQLVQEQKPNQIPVILPAPGVGQSVVNQEGLEVLFNSFQNEQVIMSSAPLTINTTQIQSNSVVIGGPPSINNIYVRPKKSPQMFQPAQPQPQQQQQQQQQINNFSNMMATSNVQSMSQQSLLLGSAPRMRHQPNNQRPPPGTVNLERSYQICQAVIQNSANPNRHQLNHQLKPPPQVMGQKKF